MSVFTFRSDQASEVVVWLIAATARLALTISRTSRSAIRRSVMPSLYRGLRQEGQECAARVAIHQGEQAAEKGPSAPHPVRPSASKAW